ncbi:MAG: methionine adenosyltransferase domain-containing protein, partial [Syntrophales bacterium]|nr:methionine adenosyltransferase domain-containing protein [Syntrophales bacterium]
SAVFGARYVAKNLVASGLATRCSVQLAYAIGIAKPMSIYVNTFNTGSIPDEKLSGIVEKIFDLTPKGMIERFDLLSGDIYRKISKTFFMGDYPWEKTDMAEKLKKEAGDKK